jgi:hypothetical protein
MMGHFAAMHESPVFRFRLVPGCQQPLDLAVNHADLASPIERAVSGESDLAIPPL